MELKDIVITPKMRKVMQSKAQIIYLFGATSTSKTVTAGIKFIDYVINSGADKSVFFILCRSIGVGIRNIIKNADGIYNIFQGLCHSFSVGGSAGSSFKVRAKTGEKIVYLISGDDASSESKLRGSNYGAIWIEEATEINENILREAMGRTISRKAYAILTSNGGMPDNVVYTEFSNYSVPACSMPDKEKSYFEIDKKNNNQEFYHFNLIEDAPFLDQEVKNNLFSIYAINSFFYNSKILGVRGYVEGAAFAQLITDENKTNKELILQNFKELILSVDIGASRDLNDSAKSATVATLVGITHKYQRVVVLDSWVVEANSHDYIIDEIEKKIYKIWVMNLHNFKKIIIDSAEAILLNTWRVKTRFSNLNIKGSIKAHKDAVTLVTRCNLKQQLILQKRLIWHSRANNSLLEHCNLLIDKDGSVLDNATIANDYNDSLDYCLTEYFYGFLQVVNRGIYN